MHPKTQSIPLPTSLPRSTFIVNADRVLEMNEMQSASLGERLYILCDPSEALNGVCSSVPMHEYVPQVAARRLRSQLIFHVGSSKEETLSGMVMDSSSSYHSASL